MSVLRYSRWIAASLVVVAGVTFANDSGPGPAPGATSKEYNVLVLRAGTVDHGLMTFSASANPGAGTGAGTNTGTTGGTTTTGSTTGGTTTTDPNTAANPAASGNGSPLLPPTTTVNSSTGQTTTTTTTPNGTTTSGTTNSGATTTGTTTPPAVPDSYWTTARANGRDMPASTDPNSPGYWTRARVNGQAAPGDTSAGAGSGGSGGIAGGVGSGTFTATFTNSATSGSWYAIDLGSFSLWFAMGNSTEGMVTFAGYATPQTIMGRTSVGTGGIIESLFTGSFFIGQAADDGSDQDTTGTTTTGSANTTTTGMAGN